MNSQEETLKITRKISKYQIVEELGRGGMGCVYKAFAPQMNKYVALKVLLGYGKDREKETQRFLREATTMAQINHPNIVQIYTIEEEQSTPYFIMDYIEGVSLKQFLKENKLNIRLFSQIMVKIAGAMAYAHNKGIVHRDLKPANIMIDKDCSPQVMDFGLVKLLKADASLSSAGAIMGTPQYMSPQQACGKKIDHLTDVYALGAILYEMLSGRPVVKAGSVAHIIYKVVNEEPTLLCQINNKLARDLETICHKALAKELDQRYQSAQELSDDIQRFLNGELIKAKSASIWKKFRYKIYKNRQAVIAAVVGIFLAVLGISIFQQQENIELRSYLSKVKKWQELAIDQKNIDKQMAIYIQISGLLTKALEISADNFKIKNKLAKVREKMGLLAKKRKNYMLSYILFKQCKNLGHKNADILLRKLKQEKKKLEKKHQQFVVEVMERIKTIEAPHEELINKYVFTIIKMQKPYVIKILIPYLKSDYKWQRLLAIRALGRFGNRYSKFENKDSVEWLLNRLKKFKDKKAIEINQQEIEEIIWALGWLKDKRANDLVYKLRDMAGEYSILWIKTKTPYRWIPLANKTLATDANQFNNMGNMKHEKGDYHRAIADYTRAIALDSKFSEAYNNRGNAYFDVKEYYKALADYGKAIALSPKYAQIYNNRGKVYKEIKEYYKAIADYDQAIALKPEFPLAYNNRGNAYLKIKQYRKAIADYSYAISLDPKFSLLYNNRGNTYQKIKEYYKAIADYNHAIALNSRFLLAYNNRGNTYQELKQYRKAIADYSYAISLNPKYSKAYNNRASAYREIKAYSKAIVDYSHAILHNPSFATYTNRGKVYSDIEKYHKAIIDFTKAIAINPKFLDAYNDRGNAYQKIKEHHKAIADYSYAISLNPRFSLTYANRGSLYLDLKQYQRAYRDLQIFLKLAPNHPAASKITGVIRNLRAYKLIK